MLANQNPSTATNMESSERTKRRSQAALAEFGAEFDQHLAVLLAPDIHKRVARATASEGRVLPRPKVGPSL